MEKLGLTAKDILNGRSGVITGFATYITGCNQVLITPKSKSGEPVESFWTDEQRVKVDRKIKRVELENGGSPGFDKPAPIR